MFGWRSRGGIHRIVLAWSVVAGMSFTCHTVQAGAKQVVIYRDPAAKAIVFAAQEIRTALDNSGARVADEPLEQLSKEAASIRIILTARDAGVEGKLADEGGKPAGELEPQGYAVRVTGKSSCWIIGADETGAMYGGLEIAEAIGVQGGLETVRDNVRKPSIPQRGIKFNIPLDARTPSYDDTGDAAQNNYAEMWNFDFWQEFLDDMARYRYNTLTLWNPHPFPSIVRLADYPDVALDNVCVTVLKPTYKAGAWRDPQFVSPEVLKNLRVVKKISIDEKIEFWRGVMAYARDRGVNIYWITWNVLTNGAEGKYGITNDQDNPKTIAYLRECVRQTILTYPLLAGIGVTAGENMKDRNDEYDREKWLWKTYGMGVLDAKKQQPGRQVRFIHRVWNSALDRIMADFAANYVDPFEIGFKYARAHMYSSPKPPFCRPLLKEMANYRVKCWWNLRNDDIFNFRWGDPEYARAFLSNLPPAEMTAGYHMGSDGYVWGREFTSVEPETPRQLEIKKHWYNFMLWGRLGYDLGLSREYFEKTLASRFPQVKGSNLYEAWASASRIIPLVNRFHWRDWDFMWAVEGCFDQPNGFHTVRDFIKTGPMEDSGLMSIAEYVKKKLGNQAMTGTTPIEVAEELRRDAMNSWSAAQTIRQSTPQISKELRLTLGDIEAMSHLGSYYASKILGAVELALFEESAELKHKEQSIRHLLQAQGHWQEYARVAGSMYKPQLLARTRDLDWNKLLEDVKRDVEIARGSDR